MHLRPADPPPARGKRLSSETHPNSFAVTPKISATGLKLRVVFIFSLFIKLFVLVLLSVVGLGFVR